MSTCATPTGTAWSANSKKSRDSHIRMVEQAPTNLSRLANPLTTSQSSVDEAHTGLGLTPPA